MKKDLSVKDIEGKWVGPTETGLVERCKESWEIPLTKLTDLMVATYLNQNIATSYMVQEAERRIKEEERDDTELYNDQLLEAVEHVKNT